MSEKMSPVKPSSLSSLPSERHRFTTILSFESLDSTNDYIKSNLDAYDDGTVVVASYQTQGRGQFERTWESQPGMNLLCSILFKNQLDPLCLSEITVRAIRQTLADYGVSSWFKNPNDIYADEYKIAGILIETKYTLGVRTSVVLGIGLNVNQQYFETTTATSILLQTGKGLDRLDVLERLLCHLENELETCE